MILDPTADSGAPDHEPVEFELIAAAEPSFAEIYRRHHAAMVRLAYLLCGSHETAHDIAQDAFVGLHRNFSHVDNVTAYLRRSIVNGVISSQRRLARARRRPTPRTETVDLGADELFDALDRLVPRQRAALVMRFHLDMADAQIAPALGVKEATVASIVHRGLAELRKVIEP